MDGMISLLPIISLSILGFFLLLLGVFVKISDAVFGRIALIGSIIFGILPVSFLYSEGGKASKTAMLSFDGLGLYFCIIFMLTSVATIALLPDYLRKKESKYHHEIYPLVVFASMGMVILAAANHFLMFFLGLELMSICFYILAGILREQEYAVEASLKYFILGVFSSSLLILGIGLIYGSTGALSYGRIFEVLSSGVLNFGEPLLLLGFVLILAGLFFKLSLVPFHFWAPDVYQGAPTPITAMLSVGGKSAALAAAIRLYLEVFSGSELLSQKWFVLFSIIGVITVFVGSLIALTQIQFKRLLAYSSIVHAGFLALGLAALAGKETVLAKAVQGLAFYAAAYLFMNISAFVCAQGIERSSRMDEGLLSLSGLGSTSPVFGALLAVNMVSLAGIPLTAGFLGKFYIFSALIAQGTKAFYWIAALGLIGAVIATFYYLKILVILYFPSKDQIPAKIPELSLNGWVILILGSVCSVFFGFFPGLVQNLAALIIQ
jgi:NADH-quinone oxidoreductase subunit N